MLLRALSLWLFFAALFGGQAFAADRPSASELRLMAELLAEPEVIAPRADFAKSAYRGAIACDIVSQIDLREAIPLGLRRGAAPYAHFWGRALRVVVPVSSAAPAMVYLTSDADGVVVQAVASPSDIPFHPSIPLELGGIVELGPRATLAVNRAGAGWLGVGYRLESDQYVVMARQAVRGRVSCADVTLHEHGFSDKDEVGVSAIRSVELPPGTAIARTPFGPAFAHVAPDFPSRGLVLEVGSECARVAVPRELDTIVGWVRAPREADEGIGLGTVGTRGYGAGFGTGKGFGTETIECSSSNDVPLFVKQGSTRRRIGFVRGGRKLELVTERASDFVVRLPGERTIELSESAEWSVDKIDIDGCRPTGR